MKKSLREKWKPRKRWTKLSLLVLLVVVFVSFPGDIKTGNTKQKQEEIERLLPLLNQIETGKQDCNCIL